MFLLLQIDKKIVRTEIGVLLRLSHPNIVSICDICYWDFLSITVGSLPYIIEHFEWFGTI